MKKGNDINDILINIIKLAAVVIIGFIIIQAILKIA